MLIEKLFVLYCLVFDIPNVSYSDFKGVIKPVDMIIKIIQRIKELFKNGEEWKDNYKKMLEHKDEAERQLHNAELAIDNHMDYEVRLQDRIQKLVEQNNHLEKELSKIKYSEAYGIGVVVSKRPTKGLITLILSTYKASKIERIIALRAITQLGLVDAKNMVEEYEYDHKN